MIWQREHLPNSDLISSNEAGWLPIPNLSKEASHASVIPQLKTSSLISLGQLCDDDCTVLLNKNKLYAVKDDKVLLHGDRNHQDGLWDIPIHIHQAAVSTHHTGLYSASLSKKQTNLDTSESNDGSNKSQFGVGPRRSKQKYNHVFSSLNALIDDNLFEKDIAPYETDRVVNIILRKDKTKQELAEYLHASCFSPVVTTFLKAIKNDQLQSWPGLTTELVKNHLPESMATALGHLNQERSNLQSTHSNVPVGLDDVAKKELIDDFFPSSDSPNVKTQDVILSI